MTKNIKITKCPTSHCHGYTGVMNGFDNPWLYMNSPYDDEAVKSEKFNLDDTIELEEKEYDFGLDLSNNDKEWESHFYKYMGKFPNIEAPRPVMVNGKPCFNGGLTINGEQYDCNTSLEVVSDLKLNHFKVLSNDIKEPNNEEYNKHFKRHYEKGSFKIFVGEVRRNNTKTNIKKTGGRYNKK